MQDKHKPGANTGLNLSPADIFYILFRHKRKILAIWALGIAVAVSLYFFWPVPYKSVAKVEIRYIEDTRPMTTVPGDQVIQSTASSPDSLINTEIEILQSLDVAKEVADVLSPSVTAKLKGATNSNNPYAVAAVIQKGMGVETSPKSSVIRIFFQNNEPEAVRPVLDQVILSYFKAHREAHRVDQGRDDKLAMTADSVKAQLSATDEQLRKLKDSVGVTSLEDTKKLNAETLVSLRRDLWAAQTELKEHVAILGALTNYAAPAPVETNSPEPIVVPDEKVSAYQDALASLQSLQKRKIDLLAVFTPQSLRVVELQRQIDAQQQIKSDLEDEFPQLKTYHLPVVGSSGQPAGQGPDTFLAERTRVIALNTRIQSLTNQMEEVQSQIAKVSAVEEKINELERLRDTQRANLVNFERKRFDTQIEDLLTDGKISNISLIQKPTPPFKDSGLLTKVVAVVFVGSLGLGVMVAFFVELYLDHSIKRPVEIETKIGLPLFLSIPQIGRNGSNHLPFNSPRLLANGNGETSKSSEEIATPAAQWKNDPDMQPFIEALRDRLLTHFEINEINHKPKLVAVTSCADGSGVSTVATGLAASLSETGEGNVLLVDMNHENGSAHFFQNGKLSCGLDEVLDKAHNNREHAKVEKNLFYVTENTADEKLPRILHKRFSALVPKLHASDFDYIIFDMPPISQTSSTTRVARFMDMVFMVVEAERTSSDRIKRASKMLGDAKATNVGVVLNKTRNYLPGKMSQEL